MGLLSFAKNIGKKLFNKEAEASTSIKNHVEEDNPGSNPVPPQRDFTKNDRLSGERY